MFKDIERWRKGEGAEIPGLACPLFKGKRSQLDLYPHLYFRSYYYCFRNEFLLIRVYLVKFCEIIDDNRNRQCDDQHAANAADAAHNFTQNSLWVDITVPHCCHSNACPPESFGNACVCRVFLKWGWVRRRKDESDEYDEIEEWADGCSSTSSKR